MTTKEVYAKYGTRGKKTRKRLRKLEEALAKVNKERKKKHAPRPNFPAMQLLNDPQGLTLCE
jgi:hypothetical protein